MLLLMTEQIPRCLAPPVITSGHEQRKMHPVGFLLRREDGAAKCGG